MGISSRAFLTLVAAGAIAAAAGTASADPSAGNLLYAFNSGSASADGWANSMAPNDDGSSAQMGIGFDFCFYHNLHNALYINNNGNVSFSGPFGSYTSTGFPSAGFDMIAPFWADVDTRNRTGADTNQVWHKSFGAAGSRVFVVTWDAVGWYNSNATPTNTFQVALAEDENQWGLGLNCAFSYGNMGWTAGTASGGGPYGGSPATVGINRGDGVDYDQLGLFDHAGVDYAGGGANPGTSGAQWLNGSRHFFNACEGIIPAPSSIALLGMGGLLASRRRR